MKCFDCIDSVSRNTTGTGRDTLIIEHSLFTLEKSMWKIVQIVTLVNVTRKKIQEENNLFADENPPGQYDAYTCEQRRKNLEILFNNTTVMPFKWRGKYICFYCGLNYAEYPEFKKHTMSHGACSTKDYALKLVKGNFIEVKIDISEIICDVCNEPFCSVNEIVDHLIRKHNLEYDKDVDMFLQEYRLVDCRCLICGEEFAYFGYLVNHVNIFHPENSFICNECGATFNKKRDLAAHFRNNHKEGGYPCELCSQTFTTRQLLKAHQYSYHVIKCTICNAAFLSRATLKKHVKSEHPDDGDYKCGYCNKESHSKQGLKQHMSKCKIKMAAVCDQATDQAIILRNLPKRKQNVVPIRKNIICVLNNSTAIPFKFFSKYSCFHCTRHYVDFDDLKQHTVVEHPVCDLKSKSIKKCKGERTSVKIDISSLACKLCSQPIAELDALIDHLISNHNESYDKSIKGCLEPYRIIKDNLPCPVCNSTFKYFGILQRHMNSQHSEHKNICDFCGRSFKNVSNLKVHIAYTHTGAVECDVCSLKFKNQWCLSRHKAKLHDAKDFKCPKCPEMFQSQYHKQKHLIKVHNEGHKCNYCGRMFTRNSFMKDHIRRTHLKEKNVPCSVCNEKFFDNYLLRMHMVKHEGDRKFTCTVCGKSFLRRSNLYSHTEMHKKHGHGHMAV